MFVAFTSSGCAVMAVRVMDEVDKTISKLAQSDCELVRALHGKEVCYDRKAIEAMQAERDKAYCYRRLGGVDCYERRDPEDRPIDKQVDPKPLANEKAPVTHSPSDVEPFETSEAGR